MRFAFTLLLAGIASAQPVRMAADPALSPDGNRLAFAWRGDIWIVEASGGVARPLTSHPAEDGRPSWSPDGTEIAFQSARTGAWQVHVVPAAGGEPAQVTTHSEGSTLEDWYPDGKALLVASISDEAWPAPRRLWRVSRQGGRGEIAVHGEAADGRVSPDGRRIAFRNEGMEWWRKGYTGSSAGRIWTWDGQVFTKVFAADTESRWPLWKPDGAGLWFCGAEGTGPLNLYELDLSTGKRRALTQFVDDSVVMPCASRDGRRLAFRILFDLYTLEPGGAPRKLEITIEGDRSRPPTERREMKTSDAAAFSSDGLEVAFIAGGDVWVMDTVLREPRRVTDTPEEERSPAFAGDVLLYISDAGGRSDVWRARRRDPQRWWWRNEAFDLDRFTDDEDQERDLLPAPDGKRFAFVKGRGDLWTMGVLGKNGKRLLESWNAPEYCWSPDGRWIAYALSDNDFNSDVWVIPSDGSAAPVNVSRHPRNESGPVWSPDGKLLAFAGERLEGETDVFYVWLRREDDEKAKRERTVEEALERMKKVRKQGGDEDAPKPKRRGRPGKPQTEVPAVVIDFEDIHERVRRVAFEGEGEGGLFWKHDSKSLAFSATADGSAKTWVLEFPDVAKPRLLIDKPLRDARWIEEGDQILAISDGVPGQVKNGKWTPWPFSARVEVDLSARWRAGFVTAWRVMRDQFYDGRLNNRDWDAIRRKYEDAAAGAADGRAFGEIVSLMLGELNASHLGFYGNEPGWRPSDAWNPVTPHFGIRWDPAHPGPGRRIADILPESPADRAAAKLRVGDLVLTVDGVQVKPADDLESLLTGALDRDVRFQILSAQAGIPKRLGLRSDVRTVVLRPASWGSVPGWLYRRRIDSSRKRVDALSTKSLGYVHIRGMDWPSFQKFEAELYSAGAGRDGLVIDVRENGGGFTADHLLTILCQPTHAITVPRGGGPGYPNDRRVYATWDKPIIVLCNQNSFSNAEIFSHAIKHLKRGRVVGVPTAGGVISTGSARVTDVGSMRTPGRGWFLTGSGEDYERNGCVPDIVLWPEPGDDAAGIDRQLDAAVDALMEDVKAWKARPRPELKPASGR